MITTEELARIRSAAIGDMLGDSKALDEVGPAATIFRLCRELELARKRTLPRALEWTDEPPKVPGYYWYRCSNENIWSPAYVFIVTEITQYGTLEGSKQEQWAGPIPAPREPKA